MTVFKAKLIEDQKFFTFRRFVMIAALGPAILPGLLINENRMQLLIIGIVVDLVLIAVMIYLSRRLKETIGDSRIELQNSQIVSWSKDGRSKIEIHEGTMIRMSEGLNLDQGKLKDIWKDLTGNPRKNYLEVKETNGWKRITFLIDSYYMLEQLKKILSEWKEKGILQ